MSRHTPGPWLWDETGSLIGSGRAIFGLRTEDNIDEMSANRSLVCAAPALLEALRNAEFWLRQFGEAGARIARMDADVAVAKCRAAIALAEGGESSGPCPKCELPRYETASEMLGYCGSCGHVEGGES